MLKTWTAAIVIAITTHAAAFAACTQDDVAKKTDEISGIILQKAETKPAEASKFVGELTVIAGDDTVTEASCTKLDDMLVRAKKL